VATTQAMPGTKVDLERAIAGLTDGAKNVLRDVQGYKYKEIAEFTGVTLGTVKAQIHRARTGWWSCKDFASHPQALSSASWRLWASAALPRPSSSASRRVIRSRWWPCLVC